MNRYRGLAVPVRGILRGLHSSVRHLTVAIPGAKAPLGLGLGTRCNKFGVTVRSAQDVGTPGAGRAGAFLPTCLWARGWRPPRLDWRARKERQCVGSQEKSLDVPNASSSIWRFWPSPEATGHIQVGQMGEPAPVFAWPFQHHNSRARRGDAATALRTTRPPSRRRRRRAS